MIFNCVIPGSTIKRDIDAFNLEKNANPSQKKRKINTKTIQKDA
jgi:hypothetical protein